MKEKEETLKDVKQQYALQYNPSEFDKKIIMAAVEQNKNIIHYDASELNKLMNEALSDPFNEEVRDNLAKCIDSLPERE